MASTLPEHVDVLIIGAGLSGIGAACHLSISRPETSFAILEARGATGGTWDLFRYPAVRSDSDMFTLGYSFEPWRDPKAIADGPSILRYIRETATRHHVDEKIYLNRRAARAGWRGVEARWTVEIERTDVEATEQITASFLWSATGYYRYDHGYQPDLPGQESFTGPIVHPQAWPEDLDVADKRIVVIGSGATAVTLVPALARSAASVAMLQRSPTYVVARPDTDTVADRLRRWLPARAAYALIRAKNVTSSMLSFQLSRRAPGLVKKAMLSDATRRLPPDFDVATHFSPSYDPWDQRICLVPNGDLFTAISSGTASVVTDQIDHLDATGIQLVSGRHLDADIIVTATGLTMLALGGLELEVDSAPVDYAEAIAYKGAMLCGVPNLIMSFGYTNASWTLKADLIAEYLCRLLAFMEERGATICTPRAPGSSMPRSRFMELESGYVLRSADELPKQGSRRPWLIYQNYLRDLWLYRFSRIDDEMDLSA